MCGIFAILNSDDESLFSHAFILKQVMKGQARGPEDSQFRQVALKCSFGFHRLAINGLNAASNQPICIGDISLVCNGEIYNYKELYEMLDIRPETQSDCEVIIHLYKKYGMEQTLQMVDGVFAFVLSDARLTLPVSKVYIARDPYGVRPLYQVHPKTGPTLCPVYSFASEAKVLTDIYSCLQKTHTIDHFQPGTFSCYTLPFQVCPHWTPHVENQTYHTTGFTSIMGIEPKSTDYLNAVLQQIRTSFIAAVDKRVQKTERPIACLLSGGLDSSLVAALVNEHYRGGQLETYSIGLSGSEDLKYAQQVADYLGTKHTAVELTESDFCNAIPEVIYAIESYDTTTVRASIGNYLLAKYISENSEAKVIFNGDGADELCGGYLYMHAAPDALEFDRETRRLLSDIHMFDVLRSDKSISSCGLEPRTPFLDRTFVQSYLSIHPSLRFQKGNPEKYLIRTAFSAPLFKNSRGDPILPEEVLWRRKEAFSDGVSQSTRSLYEIIQQFVSSSVPTTEKVYRHNRPDTDEKRYYRALFDANYPNMEHLVPYFWMPKYVKAVDASARTLAIYKDKQRTEEKQGESIQLNKVFF
jgi:asparagine synthase (glutamine-hydrolysing)